MVVKMAHNPGSKTRGQYCHCPSLCSYKFGSELGTRMGYTKWTENWPRIGLASHAEADARPALGPFRVPVRVPSSELNLYEHKEGQ